MSENVIISLFYIIITLSEKISAYILVIMP